MENKKNIKKKFRWKCSYNTSRWGIEESASGEQD